MEKKHAVAILRSALSFDDHIGAMDHKISLLEEGEEKERMRKAVGDIMGIITRHIVFPITDQYPDLDQDKYME